MTNIELQPIYHFETGSNRAQNIFDDLLHSILKYRFNHQAIIKISPKDITESIFRLTSHDRILINEVELNGQKVKELFIACIYLKYLESIYPKSHFFVATPFNEESYDVAIYFVDENSYNISENKCRLVKGQTNAYYIQVKENVDFKNLRSFSIKNTPNSFDVEPIKKLVKSYSELVLILSRNYSLFDSALISDFLNNHKNVGIIVMPSLAHGLKIKNNDGTVEIVNFESKKWHFLINTCDDTVIHIKFDEPKFLIPDETLTPEVRSLFQSISKN